MIETFITFINETLIPLGASGIFLAGVLEEAISPIPSPLVMLGAGFFFLEGPFSVTLLETLVFTIAIPVAVGITLGSLVIYGLTYRFGKPVIDRWGHWIGCEWRHVHALQTRMNGDWRDEALLFGARVIPVIPSTAIGVFCGLVRMRLWRYLAITAGGTFFRAIILAVIGWRAGDLYERYAAQIAHYEKIVLIVFILAAVAFIIYQKRARRNTTEDTL